MDRIPIRVVHLAGAPVAARPQRIREVAFVGSDVWAQIDGAVYCLGGGKCRLQLALPPKVRMNRAVGRWVEFRRGSSLRGGIDDSERNDVRIADVWMYDAEEERWHSGPWPAAVRCYVGSSRNIEPEDCFIENPVDGVSFDASSWEDRHCIKACAPDGQLIALDYRILDLATGRVSSYGQVSETLMPEDLPLIGAGGLEPDSAYCAEAVARDQGGQIWWIRDLSTLALDHLSERGIRGAFGRGADVLAWVDRSCAAAAFSPDAKRVAFMSDKRVWIVDAANPTGPSICAHTFDIGVVDDPVARHTGDDREDGGDDDDCPF